MKSEEENQKANRRGNLFGRAKRFFTPGQQAKNIAHIRNEIREAALEDIRADKENPPIEYENLKFTFDKEKNTLTYDGQEYGSIKYGGKRIADLREEVLSSLKFKVSMAEAIYEVQKKGGVEENARIKLPSTAALDNVLNKYQDYLGGEKKKNDLKKSIQDEYLEDKEYLRDHRLLGVGNSPETVGGRTLKTLGNAVAKTIFACVISAATLGLAPLAYAIFSERDDDDITIKLNKAAKNQDEATTRIGNLKRALGFGGDSGSKNLVTSNIHKEVVRSAKKTQAGQGRG